VKRKAIIIKSAEDGKRCIAIDFNNYETILAFLKEKKLEKKFTLICQTILQGIKNTDIYDKEDINSKCKYVTAMKFKSKQNARIYCKEVKIDDRVLVVIVSELLEKKKNQKNQQKEISLIEKVANYEYELY
jgi:hypothetical protein